MLTYNKFLLERKKFNKPWIKSLPKSTTTIELYDYVKFLAELLDEELLGTEINLGSGAYGTAFELKGDRVLKLTNDISEALTAKFIMDQNKDFRYIIKYYDVRKIVGSKDKNLYTLIMDKVIPLKSKVTKHQGQLWLFLDDDCTNWTPEKFAKKTGYSRNIEYIRDNWENMMGILKELASLGIYHPDIHVDNLGINSKGDVVYFDAVGKYPRNQLKNIHQNFDEVDITSFFKGTTFH